MDPGHGNREDRGTRAEEAPGANRLRDSLSISALPAFGEGDSYLLSGGFGPRLVRSAFDAFLGVAPVREFLGLERLEVGFQETTVWGRGHRGGHCAASYL